MFKLLETTLARFGYVRADSIVVPAPRAAKASSNIVVKQVGGDYAVLASGKIVFPLVVDSKGNPIEFERGVAYVVGSNGRMRKRRVVKAKSEATEISAEDGADEEAGPAHKPMEARQTFDGSKEHIRLYDTWLKVRRSCENPDSHEYKQSGPSGATMVAAWKNYDNFFADVVGLESRDKWRTFQRIDKSAPWGPGNVVFARQNLIESGRIVHNRTLTAMQVLHIRNSPASPQQLADEYGFSTATISRIRNGKTYRDVD